MPLLFGLVAKSLLKQRGCKDTKSFGKLYGFKNYFYTFAMSLSNILRTMNKKNFSYCLMAVVCTSVMTLCSCSKDKDIAPVVDPYNGREYVDLGLSVICL